MEEITIKIEKDKAVALVNALSRTGDIELQGLFTDEECEALAEAEGLIIKAMRSSVSSRQSND